EEKKEDNFYRRERFYGKFERVIPLPVEVKAEEAKAKIEDGILKLEIPKVQAEKEIKVELQ
ncbi:Hsp20/alpha crystallin family protein, partial [Hydrogenivirga sp. 128-5-R1-1]|uniref:Hsp20/alpha crystallin family protein n=1 Tax=Hydrogenivirga sp. 128-5-R1-1 TaxID=392423 RepID=UPI00015F0D24